jgi:hypothetical protein
MAVATLEALLEDRSEDEKVWASVLKEALKRRNPGFNENYFGFRTFGNLLEEAQKRGLLEFGRDEKSSAYVKRRSGNAPATNVETLPAPVTPESAVPPAPTFETPAEEAIEAPSTTVSNEAAPRKPARRSRGGRRKPEAATANTAPLAPAPEVPVMPATPAPAPAEKPARKPRAPRRKKPEAAAE